MKTKTTSPDPFEFPLITSPPTKLGERSDQRSEVRVRGLSGAVELKIRVDSRHFAPSPERGLNGPFDLSPKKFGGKVT